MIIFGTGGSVRPAVYTGCTCTACNTNSIYLVAYQKHFHIFWIPIFPIGRNYQATCANCGAIFNTPYLNIPPEAFAAVKTPKWTYAGLFLFAAFCLFLFISVIFK